MPRRVVWYPAGSPTASRLSALPGDLEIAPLPERGPARLGREESAALVVDLAVPADAAVARDLASRSPEEQFDVPVVALLAPGTRSPIACYAYVPTPPVAEVLAATLRNAG